MNWVLWNPPNQEIPSYCKKKEKKEVTIHRAIVMGNWQRLWTKSSRSPGNEAKHWVWAVSEASGTFKRAGEVSVKMHEQELLVINAKCYWIVNNKLTPLLAIGAVLIYDLGHNSQSCSPLYWPQIPITWGIVCWTWVFAEVTGGYLMPLLQRCVQNWKAWLSKCSIWNQIKLVFQVAPYCC